MAAFHDIVLATPNLLSFVLATKDPFNDELYKRLLIAASDSKSYQEKANTLLNNLLTGDQPWLNQTQNMYNALSDATDGHSAKTLIINTIVDQYPGRIYTFYIAEGSKNAQKIEILNKLHECNKTEKITSCLESEDIENLVALYASEELHETVKVSIKNKLEDLDFEDLALHHPNSKLFLDAMKMEVRKKFQKEAIKMLIKNPETHANHLTALFASEEHADLKPTILELLSTGNNSRNDQDELALGAARMRWNLLNQEQTSELIKAYYKTQRNRITRLSQTLQQGGARAFARLQGFSNGQDTEEMRDFSEDAVKKFDDKQFEAWRQGKLKKEPPPIVSNLREVDDGSTTSTSMNREKRTTDDLAEQLEERTIAASRHPAEATERKEALELPSKSQRMLPGFLKKGTFGSQTKDRPRKPQSKKRRRNGIRT